MATLPSKRNSDTTFPFAAPRTGSRHYYLDDDLRPVFSQQPSNRTQNANQSTVSIGRIFTSDSHESLTEPRTACYASAQQLQSIQEITCARAISRRAQFLRDPETSTSANTLLGRAFRPRSAPTSTATSSH